jgi:hypothetical protein
MSKRKDPINDFFTHFDTLGDEAQQLVASILMTKVKKKASGNGSPKSSSNVASASKRLSPKRGLATASGQSTLDREGNAGGVAGSLSESGGGDHAN